jgi:hypothetical protein
MTNDLIASRQYNDVYHYNVKQGIHSFWRCAMKLTKEKAADKRQSVIETAGRLLRT